MKYYHFCTEGLKRGVIFRDDEDFIVGMNYVAITARECNLVILAFCLMSNHWHFVVWGNLDDIARFNTMLKRRISMWLHQKYGVNHYLKSQATSVKEVENVDYLRKVIGYVLRNPVVAGINCTIESYRWSSGGCYFNQPSTSDVRDGHMTASEGDERRTEGPIILTDKTKGVMTDRAKGIICKTNSNARKGFMPDVHGMIHPVQYIDREAVMGIFRTAKSFIYNVMAFKSFDMDLELENGLAKKITMDDSKLLKIADSICLQEFNVKSTEMLPTKDRCRIAVMLRKQYGASDKQISRILDIDPEVVGYIR